jgi:outer membrane protein OmpA-like peptidoglycan-associated protein
VPGAPAAAQTAPGLPARPGAAAPAVATAPIDPKTQPQRLDQVKAERKEVREGNTTIIQESNRTIIQEGGQTIIRHDASDRFRLNARAVNVVTRGNITVTAVVQPGGFQIVTETDVSGRMLRRIRRDAAGREVILIDNSFEPRGPGIAGFVLDLRPPVITIAPQLYIRDVAGASLVDISLTLAAPPVERIERRYALDEILYNEPLRARMPRVDIDTVNFETGSWEITPDQAPRLEFVAQGILAAVKRNPGEMFLVEGYTDAVGNDVDNLSLSDHRAESVAVMLTNQFGVPAENLTTQGYGKQFLKVPTPGPERANRRVAVRRITPLLNGGQS